MKTRFVVAVLIGLSAVNVPLAKALVTPAEKSLTNFDKREASATMTKSSLSGVAGATRMKALESLQNQIPQVRVAEDAILGSARFISASRGFLTGPSGSGKAVTEVSLKPFSSEDPHRVIKAFINEHADLLGHDAGVLTSARIQRDYVTEHNGLRTVVWQQMQDGIPVFESLLVGHITRQGELVNISDLFVPDVTKAAMAGTPNREALLKSPPITPARAVVSAAGNLGVDLSENLVTGVKAPQGVEQKMTLAADGLGRQADAQLTWLPMSAGSMRLCWQVIVNPVKSVELYLVLVDAETGEVYVRHSLTEHIQPATYNVFPSDSPSPFSPGYAVTGNSAQPPLTNRTLITVTALNTNASPSGWVPDGPGPRTTGNNADAFRCRDLNTDSSGAYVPDVPRPQATGANRVFDFPINLTNNDPIVYASASTVQLFYRANWYHDRLYQLGFTEAAGNFQTDNFGRGGQGQDEVTCLVQAGANLGIADNSTFSTPPDGSSGICSMFIFSGPSPNRDGSLDQDVVVHELTHGLSNRLLGGGAGISKLQTRGMGEGWSDFYALSLLSESTDDVNGNYAAGGYASYLLAGLNFKDNYYFGIRRYPYTTDMAKNPLTFKDIDPTKASTHSGIPISPLFGGSDPAEFHNQGEVWCVTLWEVRVNLVEKWGWDIGNQLALQLVTDGLKLAPVNANFLEARDGILQADEVDNGGDNFAELWTGFAKRGMGVSANCPASSTSTGVVEAYDTPAADGVLDVVIKPAPFSSLFTGDIVTNTIRVTDLVGITNATISATIIGSTNLAFLNNGVGADKKTNDAVYTAVFKAPATPGTMTVNLEVSATNKVSITNSYTYFIVATPPNDNFASATKVPAAGTNYISI